MKVKLNKGKVIAIREKGKLVRYDENSEPFFVSDEIGKDLIKNHSAELIEDTPDYEKLKVAELRELAKANGLEESGTKEELVERLRGEES